MGIIHFRLDQRLIHGQVALAWSQMTEPNHIIVANDEASENQLKATMLKMAAPKQVRVSIQPVVKVAKYLMKPISEDERIFLLVDNINDAKKLHEYGVDFADLNIGNMTHKPESRQLTSKIFIRPEEELDINYLIDKGVNCYFQILPNDEKIDFRKILRMEEN